MLTIDVDNSVVAFNHNNQAEALVVKERLKALGYPSIDDDNNLVSKAKSFVSCAAGKLSQ